MPRISELPAATLPLGGTELVPLVQGGTTKQAPSSAVLGGGGGGTTYSNFTPSVAGLVPPPGGATGKFLGDDGTWHVLPSGTATPGGSSGQFQVNSSGSFAGVTVTGDGTLASNGSLTVLKINGQTPSAMAFATFGQLSGSVAQGNDTRIVGAQQTSAKGAPNGYAGLDGNSKVPLANLPAGSGTGIVVTPDATLNGSTGQTALDPTKSLIYLNPPNTSTIAAPTLFTLANGSGGANAGILTAKNVSNYPCALQLTLDGVSKTLLLYSPQGQNSFTGWWDFNQTSWLSLFNNDWGWRSADLAAQQINVDADIYNLTQSIAGTPTAVRGTLGQLKAWVQGGAAPIVALTGNFTLSGSGLNRRNCYTTTALTMTVPTGTTLTTAGDFDKTCIYTDGGAMTISGTLLDYFNTLGGGINATVSSIPANKKVEVELWNGAVHAMIYPIVTALAVPIVTTSPTVSGSAQVGQTLVVSDGAASGNPVPTVSGRQWYWIDTNAAISGATSTTYVPVTGDIGHTISCKVTWTNSQGTAVGTSAPTVAVTSSSAPTVTAIPTISGTAQVGATLTGADGTASGSPSPTVSGRQWYWGDTNTAITGATGTTYVPVVGDIGHTITFKVTWTNTGGTAVGTSAATAAVIAASGAVPSFPTLPGTGLNASVISVASRWMANAGVSLTGGAGTVADQSGNGHALSASVGVSVGASVGTHSLPTVAFAGLTQVATSGLNITGISPTSGWLNGVMQPPINFTMFFCWKNGSSFTSQYENIFSYSTSSADAHVILVYDYPSGHFKFWDGAEDGNYAHAADLGAAAPSQLNRVVWRLQDNGTTTVNDIWVNGTKTNIYPGIALAAYAYAAGTKIAFGQHPYFGYGAQDTFWCESGVIQGALPDTNCAGGGVSVALDDYLLSKWG